MQSDARVRCRGATLRVDADRQTWQARPGDIRRDGATLSRSAPASRHGKPAVRAAFAVRYVEDRGGSDKQSHRAVFPRCVSPSTVCVTERRSPCVFFPAGHFTVDSPGSLSKKRGRQTKARPHKARQGPHRTCPGRRPLRGAAPRHCLCVSDLPVLCRAAS